MPIVKSTFTVDVGEVNTMVSFKVYNADTLETIYMMDKTSDSDGKAVFAFISEAEAGTYVAVAKNCDTNETAEKTFSLDPRSTERAHNKYC